MRTTLVLAIISLLGPPVCDEQARPLKFDQPAGGKNLPVKQPRSGNSCAAEYGAGFVKLAGSDTCVKVGGSVGVGVRTGVGR
jgi:hypothetical protein